MFAKLYADDKSKPLRITSKNSIVKLKQLAAQAKSEGHTVEGRVRRKPYQVRRNQSGDANSTAASSSDPDAIAASSHSVENVLPPASAEAVEKEHHPLAAVGT